MEISVIIPVYNKAPYLDQCFESTFAQDFAAFEVVAVDDGSTDGSGDICDRWAAREKRLRVFHVDNGGVTAARRQGVAHAEGRYIMFLDADDELLPHALQTLHSAIERTGADEVIGRFVTQHGQESPVLYQGDQPDLKPMVKAIVANKNRFPILWGLICRRDLVADCLDTPRNIIEGEDLLTQLKMLMKHPRVHFITDCVYRYSIGVPNSRRRTLDLEKAYDAQLRQVLHAEWPYYQADYVLRQIKQYERFLLHGDASVRQSYYAEVIPSPLPAGVPLLHRMFWLLPPRLSVIGIRLYQYLLKTTKTGL